VTDRKVRQQGLWDVGCWLKNDLTVQKMRLNYWSENPEWALKI